MRSIRSGPGDLLPAERGQDRRAGRGEQFARHRAEFALQPGDQSGRRGRGHRQRAVLRLHRPAAQLQRREEHRADAEPLEARDRADDVRDRVERADFVEVDLLDRHVMDRRFGLAEPREDGDRALLHALRQARAEDHRADRLEAAVRVVRFVGRLDGHLQRADAAAQGLLGAEPDQPGREQRQVGRERLERQPAVEQRAEDHVAAGAGEAIEIRDGLAHGSGSFLIRGSGGRWQRRRYCFLKYIIPIWTNFPASAEMRSSFSTRRCTL